MLQIYGIGEYFHDPALIGASMLSPYLHEIEAHEPP
jgi:hypothetical protein